MSARVFDLVVIGLGHAGAEAALAAKRLGLRVAAVTQAPDRACLLSCNPSIGGPGKSQLVREIDALGGAMAMAADESATQVRVLNQSKGAASWATRLQVDRARYAQAMQKRLAGLTIVAGEAESLVTQGDAVQGVALTDGSVVASRAVILTTGTFLAARMHVGTQSIAGGRVGDAPSNGLSLSLSSLGMRLGRFKTGTPPRLDGRTIDWGACAEQPSEPAESLSRWTKVFPLLPQRSAFVTRTNARTHAVVEGALNSSPLTTGAITGRGPRYCPSLEQKVVHYPERTGHLVYLEPEGLDTDEVYPAGLSTSLPADTQLRMLRTIRGLEAVELVRPGYAVEYDHLVQGQLRPWLEHAGIKGLFFGGQINGSSGYEEAAAQGLVAGTNAALSLRGAEPWVPTRAEAYLGVLCDDLVNRPQGEPYRILPSRAEHRLRLREDNAHHRLAGRALTLGLISEEAAAEVIEETAQVRELTEALSPADRRRIQTPELSESEVVRLMRPALGPAHLASLVVRGVRYAPYEEQRQRSEVRFQALWPMSVPEALRYEDIPGLSAEAREALSSRRPRTLGEAVETPGVTDAAAAVLAAHLRRRAQLEDVPRGTVPPR